jgi:hypothetical protein
MAASLSRNDARESFREDDYRAYLISRNSPPVVHPACGVRLKRWRVRLDRAVNATDRMLHRMIEALARSKTRRIQRELQLRGIRYAQRTDDDPSSTR